MGLIEFPIDKYRLALLIQFRIAYIKLKDIVKILKV